MARQYGTILLLLIVVCSLWFSSRRQEGYTGQMTHYAGSEPELGYGTGTVGYMGTNLKANKSVAVKESEWRNMWCRKVTINGKNYIVDNVCRGPTCKTFDLYLGDNVSASTLAKKGIKNVTWTKGGQDKKCVKNCKWNCP